MKKVFYKICFAILLSSSITTVNGQNEEDALRYSYLQFGGTARYIGTGGAFGALGADLSVLSINPAGMARYKKSELSFTPNVSLSSTTSNWKNNNHLNGKENFNINNFGIVGTIEPNDKNQSKWSGFQLGLSYNRLADFNEKYSIKGENNASMSYVFANRSIGIAPSDLSSYVPFDGDLAYQTYITDYDTLNGIYTTRMSNEVIYHDHEVTRKGRVGEYVAAISGNYNQRFYIGGSIGFPRIHFTETKSHYENEIQDSTENTESFTFNEYQLTSGNGVNAKIGIILLPFQWLRIGAAYHTRTFYTMTDFWDNDMNATVQNENYYYSSPQGNYSYRLRTPNKLIGSASVIIKKLGLISVDYSRVDLSASSLLANRYNNDYDFSSENTAIDSNYTVTHNIQLGTELRLGKFFMIRAGYAIFQNPFVEVNDPAYNRTSYSAGFGYRNKNYFIDFGYRLSKWKENYYMYDPAIVDNSTIDKSLSNLLVTIGFKW